MLSTHSEPGREEIPGALRHVSHRPPPCWRGWHLRSCREWLPRGGRLCWILHEPVNVVRNVTIMVLLRDLNQHDIASSFTVTKIFCLILTKCCSYLRPVGFVSKIFHARTAGAHCSPDSALSNGAATLIWTLPLCLRTLVNRKFKEWNPSLKINTKSQLISLRDFKARRKMCWLSLMWKRVNLS